jgi:hypothetical protein
VVGDETIAIDPAVIAARVRPDRVVLGRAPRRRQAGEHVVREGTSRAIHG